MHTRSVRTVATFGLLLLQLTGNCCIAQPQSINALELIVDRIDTVLEQTLPIGPCRLDINRTLEAARNHEEWAMTMLDATVKFPDAIGLGARDHLGSYDECLMSDRTFVRAQYCLARVSMVGFRTLQPTDRYDSTNITAQIRWGVCIPAGCTEHDVERLLSGVSGYEVSAVSCQDGTLPTKAGYDRMQICSACVLLAFVLMVVFSTLYGAGGAGTSKSECAGEKTSTGVAVLRAFSAVDNLRKLAQLSKDDHGLGCINGIKALSMVFILGGHALVFMAGGPLLNPGFFREQSRLLQNAFLLNSPLLVDTFLLLSGFLFARLLLLELDKRQGRLNFGLLYMFRYIRLTPAYLAVIALYATWLPRLGDGPLWKERIELEQARCQQSWWLNVLYVNNYFGTDRVCMFQSWYLATDTQLFVLAPLLLYPMWRYGHRVALLLLGSVTFTSILVPFYVTYVRQLDPTFMIFTAEVSDLQSNEYFVNVYGKTHLRATAYLFGLLVGYLVHWMQIKNVRIGRRKLALCWIVSTVCGCTAMFSLTAFYTRLGTGNYLYNALYAGLHRFGWSLSNGWLVLACVTGHGRTLKRFLSWRAFVPLSRLTYCAYLTNGLVELYLTASRRTSLYASIATLTAESIAHMILTFLLALLLCLMFESPIHGLEKILLSRFRPAHPSTIAREQETNSLSTNNTHSTSEEA
ncbi:nose resistant to fluoxetine protein 6-like [Anopheles funestus]|uniref:Nose resistant-to-fluoxetine protein N-terminal domain-containing protein n=1 Tax=Anopheles funestus TaxID=62324 RepID=A0A182R9I6_ANOFN|nr:nose resistant to fluoxetine protein 6-like [Anopheles funestus]